MSECQRVRATKRQKAAVERRLQQVPEEIRPEVAACFEAMWQEEAKATREHCQDLARRKLVGARVPRELADRIQAAAAAQDISIYSWVMAAYAAKLAEDERPPWI